MLIDFQKQGVTTPPDISVPRNRMISLAGLQSGGELGLGQNVSRMLDLA